MLLLLKANNKAGYVDVLLFNDGRPKPYQARVMRGGKKVHLGSFATAEEAALCVARSPVGRAAACGGCSSGTADERGGAAAGAGGGADAA